MIPCNGLRLLDRLGVYEPISQLSQPTLTSVMYSSGGRKMQELDLGAWSMQKTGYCAMRVKRTDLQDVLIAAVRKEGIPIHFAKQITEITDSDDSITVSFSDGTTDTADLLLGCDGIHSSVRRLYVDPPIKPVYTGLATVYSFVSVASLPTSSPSVEYSSGTMTRDGMFAVMPCTASGDTLFWFFQWEVSIPPTGDTQDGWEEQSRQEEDSFKTTLLGFLSEMQTPWGTFLRDVVSHTDVVKFYPIFSLPLDGWWSRGRCLLLGDAAHGMAPHSGQGVGMALEDVFLLSRLLATGVMAGGLTTVFEKFDAIRRPRVNSFSKLATIRGAGRKKTGVLAQWIKEFLIGTLLWVVTVLGLHRLGIGEGMVVYDIEEAPI